MDGIRAVFIDIDNTLLSFDGYVKQTMKTGFDHFGLKKYEDWMSDVFFRINNGLWEAIEREELTFEELKKVRWNKVFKELGIDFEGPVFETYFRKELNSSAIPMEGAQELVRYLSGRYILCAASNGPYEQQVNRLRIAGMLPYFHDVYVSENIGSPKPTEEYFRECMKRLNESLSADPGMKEITPGEVMMIGDSFTSDMAGGVTFGMKTCLYNFKEKKVPEDSGINYTVTSLADIPGMIL